MHFAKPFRQLLCVSALIACSNASTSASRPQDARTRETTGSISGRVTIAGKPAVGMPVIMAKEATNPFDTGASTKVYTDEDGRFQFSGVPQGRYRVAAFAPAFVSPGGSSDAQPGKSVTLAEGETAEEIDFALVRGGVITGRVVDADGLPIVDQYVNLERVDESGRRLPGGFNPFRYRTDDRGVYRMFGLAPGRYLVSIGDRSDAAIVRIGGAWRSYPLTYHPDASDAAKAKPVVLNSGIEVSAIDIRLPRPVKTYSASGRIIDGDTGNPVAGVRFGHGALQGDSKRIGAFGWSGTETGEKGEFRIDSLTPGRYAAFAVSEELSDFYSENAYFEITNADVTGLEVKIRRGGSIAGAVAIEGTDDPQVLGMMSQIRLSASVQSEATSGPRLGTTSLGADGSFRIIGLSPGKATIRLDTFPAPPKGLSLARVERDGLEQREGIQVAPGEQVTGVRVVLVYGSAVLRGQVKIQGGELQAGSRLLVSVKRQGSPMPTGGSQVDARNRFVIEGLAPGEYEVTVRVMPPFTPGVPVQPGPSATQNVQVTGSSESEIIVVLDLGPKQKDKDKDQDK